MSRIISSFSDVSENYDVIYCDLWGCLHDGARALPPAVDALVAFRERGGKVVLVTNAPRPNRVVAVQTAKYGVPPEAFDIIVSSGDAAQAAAAAGRVGRRIHHIGAEKDYGFFVHDDGTALAVDRVPLEDAEGIICTGLLDDRTQTPDDYRETLARGVALGLPMLCANPDIMVDFGDKRVFCAGAIAAAYSKAGGTSLYFGKPHKPIYDLSWRRLVAKFGPDIGSRIVCIGDGIDTDVLGAINNGMESIFITGGLAAEQTGTGGDAPDPVKLAAYLEASGRKPTFTMGYLR